MTAHDPNQKNSYIFDPENATEMARLILQDRLVTEAMNGSFPERPNLEGIYSILDIGCGPGGWALDVAHHYPDRTVVGIDISNTMIEYANAQAQVMLLDNVTFHVMNALQPLQFADETFDLVNIRGAVGFIRRDQWPLVLRYCRQVLRPGGTIRLTEGEMGGYTSSAACEQMSNWSARAMHQRGYGFSPDGNHLGILPMLELLLSEAGYQNIQMKAHFLNFSAGTALHDSQYQNYMVGLALIKPLITQTGFATVAEFEQTYQEMLEDMQQPKFRGLWCMLTTWGEK